MLYEVVLTTVFQGQNCINRWNYEGLGTPAAVTGSFALTSVLGAISDPVTGYPAGLMSEIANLVSVAVTFDNILVKALYDDVDFYATPFLEPLVGEGVGEALPPFNSFGFRTNRVRRDIRRATKRLVGVPESASSSGTVTAPALTLMEEVAAEMGNTKTYNDEGNTLTFVPTIVSRQRYNPETQLPDPKGTAYRYYPTEAEQMQHIAQGIVWDPYQTIRSQASRQVGHGN